MSERLPAEQIVREAEATMRYRQKCADADARVASLADTVEQARLAGVLSTPAGRQALAVWTYQKQIAANVRAGRT